MEVSGVVTLTTDFGTRDAYAGAMKGVIRTLAPRAAIIDITHDIAPQDVVHGAYVMAGASPHFPPGTIHVGVVDPGVGTARRAMALAANGMVFVGPDNGLFSFALGGDFRAFALPIPKDASMTFHGRDVFAPAAARIAAGADIASLGDPFDDPVRLAAWEIRRDGGRVIGCVVHIDRFGNAVTNLRPSDFPQGARELGLSRDGAPARAPIVTAYGETARGAAIWLVGSDGCYELAVNGGSAAEKFGIERGDPVTGL
ncbi:SAM-dependent chlorinase/fluorinase [bacterium]|nr:SAM-dependent chlorinase/fluorinase [bacterium]